ncbi:MAG: hypothetical protein AAF928_06865 [Myxococcota bacterium]
MNKGGWARASVVASGVLGLAFRAAGAEPAAPEPVAPPDPSEATPAPPLRASYFAYGAALTGDYLLASGASCRARAPRPVRFQPCILGSGGGAVLRAGYRAPGRWYVGGAYQFTRNDSDNLYRLAIMQQLRFESRYLIDTSRRTRPFVLGGVGGVVYGNEWGVETGGAHAVLGVGFEFDVGRTVLAGMTAAYHPMVLAGFRDSGGFERPAGVAHYLRVAIHFEVRRPLTR